tara:strand:+ start:141 stop:389 length:249 start_codon:yes stop_codon:yes gene_type:complete
MATYNIISQSLNQIGKIEYLMQLDSEEAVVLTYSTAPSMDTINHTCDVLLAEKQKKAEDQAKIDKAIKEALWTDDEREHLSG